LGIIRFDYGAVFLQGQFAQEFLAGNNVTKPSYLSGGRLRRRMLIGCMFQVITGRVTALWDRSIDRHGGLTNQSMQIF